MGGFMTELILSKKELESFYRKNSNLETCKKFGISTSTLSKYLKEMNIKMKGYGNKKTIVIKD